MNNSEFSMLGKIADLTEALARDPRSTVFVSLAEAYRQMGLLDDALEIAARGTQSLPDYGPGYITVGRIQIQKGNLEEAARALEAAISLDGGNFPALKNLARIRLKQGDRKRAGELLRQAAALKPGDPETLKLLKACGSTGPVGEKAPEPPGAEKPGKTADPISTPTLAEIYIRQGFYKRAMRIYRDLLKSDPSNTEVRRKLVDLKKRMENAANQQASIQEAPPGAAIEGEAMSTESKAAGPDDTLETFERWLGAIQRRRENVRFDHP